MRSTSMLQSLVMAVRCNADVVNARNGGELDFSDEHATQAIADLREDGYVIAPAAPSTAAVTAAAQALAEDRHEPMDPFDEPTVISIDIDRAKLVLAAAQAAAPAIDLAQLHSALSELDLHDVVDNDHDNGYRRAITDVQDTINELLGKAR